MSEHAERFELKISQDKLSADLVINPEFAEGPFTYAEIKDYLAKNAIVFGVNENLIFEVCEAPKKFAGTPIRIAEGKAPIPGEPARVEHIFSPTHHDGIKPKELEDGRVDYYNVVDIANVTRGQLVAKKIPAGRGEDGTNVHGLPVAAVPGKDTNIKTGKNVLLSQDKMLLYAAIDGQISVDNSEKINVFPVYEVKGDVDFSVGNIDFVGTVVIRGNVPTGFRIKASGDIRILGSVEGAELEAGGSVEIKSGIAAQDKGHVIAGVDVKTSYIQNGNVRASNDVIVSQSIMFSNIRAGQNVLCNGPKGIIIGGSIQAGEKIVARVIGNSSATPTVLEVGVKPELRNELQTVIKELTNSYDNLKKTDQGLGVIDHLLHTGVELSPDKKMLQIKMTNTKIMLEKEIKKLEAQKKELEIQLDHEAHAVVDVYNVMYPGIKLVFGKLIRFIKQEFPRTRFLVVQGEITTSQLLR
ncbi:DUF342 domain-containing protein [Brevibacillus sp. SYSU BS000544]|uniref:DUF342 domain-containing protein n=1 Tax=Brevibacillus sp. SYSU BS000544 TaxID=3416443 RepID=UPI003CE4DFE6